VACNYLIISRKRVSMVAIIATIEMLNILIYKGLRATGQRRLAGNRGVPAEHPWPREWEGEKNYSKILRKNLRRNKKCVSLHPLWKKGLRSLKILREKTR
jgi:hypothetical protein